MMSTPSGVALVKTSGDMVRVCMGRRESQHAMAFGWGRCGYWVCKRERW